jgi:glutaredoxin
MSRPLLACLAPALLLAAGSACAQYKVVGPDGKVTYTDQPQPGAHGEAASVASGGTAANASLPYALRQTANRYPVTLYVGKDCRPCDAGRQLLQQRGIPYSERRVETNADGAELQRLSGSATLPTLAIGSQYLRGLASSEWNGFLDAAGYPKTSALPAGWHAPAPSPLAPVKASAPPQEPAVTAPPAPAVNNTPVDPSKPNIRF